MLKQVGVNLWWKTCKTSTWDVWFNASSLGATVWAYRGHHGSCFCPSYLSPCCCHWLHTYKLHLVLVVNHVNCKSSLSYHRMVLVGGDLWVYLALPLLKQGYLEQGVQDNIQATFEDLQGGNPTAYLGNLCQCSITHTTQQCCQVLRRNLISSSLCPLPLVLALGTTEKNSNPSTLHLPFRYL